MSISRASQPDKMRNTPQRSLGAVCQLDSPARLLGPGSLISSDLWGWLRSAIPTRENVEYWARPGLRRLGNPAQDEGVSIGSEQTRGRLIRHARLHHYGWV